MNPKFVVSHLDQQMGPFDEQELKMKWASGEILPIDYIYDEEKEDWILLADRFAWAAKPVTDDGNAPPPIRDVNIMKRSPPPGRPENSKVVLNPLANGAPVLSNTAPVSETLKQAMDIIKYTEIAPRKTEAKAEPKPMRIEMPVMTATQVVAPAPAPAPTPATPVAAAPTPAPAATPAAAKAADPFLKLDMMMPLAPTDTIAPPAPRLEAQPGFLAMEPAKPAPEVRTPPVAAPKHSPSLEIRRHDPNPAQVTLVNGVAEIDFTPANPGNLQLDVKDTTGSNIRSTEPLVVNVKALEPVQVVWQYPSYQTVGQDVEVLVRALDDRGHLCEHYNEQYMIQIRGPVSHDVPVNLKGGQATILLNHTKAERWDLTLIYAGAKHVRLPEPAELEWQPGAAVKLVLDGPHEYLAGDPMKVKVKAVDAYGNTAKTFQGTVALEIKAS